MQSAASGVLNSGMDKVKQRVENTEKDHNDIDELIRKDTEQVDKMYGETFDAYQKIESKNGNITTNQFNNFYDKYIHLFITAKNMTEELIERKKHTDLIERAKIDVAILNLGRKALTSTGRLVFVISSLRRNLKKQQEDLFSQIDSAKANGQLSDQQKQQFQSRLKDLAQKIRDHKQNMESRMFKPILKLLQIAYKMELDQFENMAKETDQKANQLQ